MKRRCPKCGHEWEGPDRVGVREECPECAAFLHTCLNCVRLDASTRACTLPDVEAVRDPGVANFCEEFVFAAADGQPPEPPAGSRRTAEKEARRKFEDLFRDGEP
jgi:hypothetical protein